jgi:hypothetical protein
MAWIAENLMLKMLNQDIISKTAYNSISLVPNIGIMVKMGGMVWNMLNEENKKLVDEFIQKSYVLKGYHNKFLILTKIARHAPSIDMSLPIPAEMIPLLDMFGIIHNVNTTDLQNE